MVSLLNFIDSISQMGDIQYLGTCRKSDILASGRGGGGGSRPTAPTLPGYAAEVAMTVQL